MLAIKIAKRTIGNGYPSWIVAELGINHNGNLQTALDMIDNAVAAGADAIKFQKRTPEFCVPRDQWDIMRETPWGYVKYIQYRNLIEFEESEYDVIDKHCKEWEIPWFTSVWDEPSVDFMAQYNPPCYKIPSAMLTNKKLIDKVMGEGKPVIISTGMSTKDEIKKYVPMSPKVALLHCTSTYPCQLEHLNLRMIRTLREWYPNQVIGFSNHSPSIIPPVNAVVLGAKIIEAHFTLDRASWGTDQGASIEPHGFEKMVHYIRATEKSLGDGKKVVYGEEKIARTKLRGDA